jgi:hypothetical protein
VSAAGSTLGGSKFRLLALALLGITAVSVWTAYRMRSR